MEKLEIHKGIKKYVDFSEYESTAYVNLWNTAKAVLLGKFTVFSISIRK